MEFDREAVFQSLAPESAKGLAVIEPPPLEMEDHPEPADSVALIFRIVRTLKDNALLLRFDSLSMFAQPVENVLDRLRTKDLKLDRRLNLTGAVEPSVEA